MRLRQRFVNNVISELLRSKRLDVDLDVNKPFVLCLNLNLLYHFSVNNFLFFFCYFHRGVALYFIDKVRKKQTFCLHVFIIVSFMCHALSIIDSNVICQIKQIP